MKCYLSYRCEADPSALAKYVIALVKKDKSTEALRNSMIEQLQVFLQEGKYKQINFANDPNFIHWFFRN